MIRSDIETSRSFQPAMANTTFGRGACPAPYLQETSFSRSGGCQYIPRDDISALVDPVLMIDRRAGKIVRPGAVSRRDD